MSLTLPLPLAGLRVLTLENFGAGPFGSMYLADLGAEVIKVENRDQGGDATRAMGPYFLGPHDSQFFQAFNLNKKSLTLNLKHPEGREAFHRLVRTADAARLFQSLGRAGILVRRFADHPSWLRLGLPGGEPDWQRLERALASF